MLVYHDWARLVSLTSGIWILWGAIWGIFYRKFFLDMIGGTLGPNGLIAPPSSTIFITLIVKMPVLQIFAIISALLILASGWPVPLLKRTFLHRSFVFKIALHVWAGFIAMLIYQTFDATFVSFLAAGIYSAALKKGEVVKVEGKNGRRGENV